MLRFHQFNLAEARIPTNWHNPEVALTPEFRQKIQDSKESGQTHLYAGTVGSVFNKVGLVDHLPQEVKDASVHLMPSMKSAGGSKRHTDGTLHLVLNPNIGQEHHAPIMVHEIQHVADLHAGMNWQAGYDKQKKAMAGQMANTAAYRTLPHEKRAQKAQATGKIIAKKPGHFKK